MKGFKSFSELFRNSRDQWLLVHKHGEYEYRNPDSVFIHRWESFPTREAALEYLDQRIAPADRHEWNLYLHPTPPTETRDDLEWLISEAISCAEGLNGEYAAQLLTRLVSKIQESAKKGES